MSVCYHNKAKMPYFSEIFASVIALKHSKLENKLQIQFMGFVYARTNMELLVALSS